jgi:hypothetical protein
MVGKLAKIIVLQTQKKIKKNRCSKHLAAPTLISRPMTIDSAGVAEKEIDLIQNSGEIKRQKDTYHHSPRPIPIIFHGPHFSLPSTFQDT